MIGFFDFLKGVLPDALVKSVNKSNNRTLIIKDSVVIIGENKFTDKKTVDSITDRFYELRKMETFPFHLIHEDLLDDFIAYEDISIRDKSNLKLLKNVLPYDEVECILMARRVLLAHDKKETKLANELMKQLEDNYPKHGKKVYNLVSCGYFDEMILPFIEVYKSNLSPEEYIKEYNRFYSELLKFFPIAIFVGNNTTEDNIRKKLLERLKLKDIPFIRLHTIGEMNITKIENIVSELEIDKSYTIKNEKFITSSGINAQIYEIKLKRY